jgi:hypothetical protein
VDHETDHQAERVDHNVALAFLDFFPASKPRRPTLSVVFTLWLSMTPAVGLGSRPAASRASKLLFPSAKAMSAV